MKKKIFNFILAICLALPLSILTACGENPENPASLTKEDYIEVFDSMKTSYMGYLSSSVSPTSFTTTFEDGDYINKDGDSAVESSITATVAFMNFTRHILNRQDYVLTQEADDFYAYFAPYDNTYQVRMKLGYDADTSTILVQMTAQEAADEVSYFDYAIKYDFTANTLVQFDLALYDGPNTNCPASNVVKYRFKDNHIAAVNTSLPKFATYAQGVVAALEAFIAPAREANPDDYSTEYALAMNEAWGEF